MIKALALPLAIAASAACGHDGQATEPREAVAATPAAPRGASLSADGYATILDAPPAPFVPAQPGAAPPPPPPSADQAARQEQWRRVAEFQNRVREEVEALSATLRAKEKGNFVDLYYENEGDPHVVFRFLRDGPRTLAKYTRNPKFVASEARYSMEELRGAMEFMFKTFADDRVIQAGGIGNKANRAEIEISVPPKEFWALVERKGVKIPDAVTLEFRASQPAAAINRPLPPAIAPLVRIFPRADRPLGMVNAIETSAKVVLQDGCFRMMGGEHDGALVQFPLGAQLFVDREGFLAYGEGEAPGYARVGEEIVFPGSIGVVTAPDLVRPIHAACGPGEVAMVTGMASAAARRAEQAVSTNASSLRALKNMYGLSEPLAARVFDKCNKQMGMGVCMMSPPPPMKRENCPAGTMFSSGLCRTPEGYVRPLPKWIAELVDANASD